MQWLTPFVYTLYAQADGAEEGEGAALTKGEYTFETLWRYPAGGKTAALTYDAARNIYYAVAEDRYLHSVTGLGKEIWRSYINTGKVSQLQTGCDGTVYLAMENELSAVNRSGGVIWTISPFRAAEDVVAALIPLADGTLISIGEKGNISAHSHASTLRWRAKVFGPGTAGGVSSCAESLRRDGAFLLGFSGGDLVCLSENGVEQWYRREAEAVDFILPFSEGYGVISGDSLVFYSFEGEELWRRKTGETDAATSSPSGKFAVIRDSNGFLRAFNNSGEEIWRTSSPVEKGDLAIGGGVVSFLGEEGRSVMYSYHGELLSRQQLPPPISNPVMSSAGTLVYGGRDWLISGFGYQLSERAPGERNNKDGCSAIRSGGIDSFPVIKEELEWGTRERRATILRRIEGELLSKEPKENKKAYISVLETLAGEGVLAPEYRHAAVENDFPEIRTRAVELLGKYGDHGTAPFIRSLLSNEWDSTVTLHCIEALGKLGGAEDGSGLSLMEQMVSSAAYNGNDPGRFALTVLEAVKEISRYRGRVSGEVMEILRHIYLGSFPGSVRNEAISTLRGLKGSVHLHFSDYTEGERDRRRE
ncbi:MAG: PQQ-binding-like beta-propeller repeat protein [Spirochaetaceae bacterium]